jgi:tetratricopeptide (TPR) repeat protein
MCERLISVSEVPGGNPVARADPEGFALTFQICVDCHANFCDRCQPDRGGLLRKPSCMTCGGRLVGGSGKRHREISMAPKPEAIRQYEHGAKLVKDRRYADALPALEQAIRLRPRYVAAHSWRGIALRFVGRYAEAVPALDQALQLHPGDVEALFHKAACFGAQKRMAEALEVYGHALRIQPRFYGALVNQGVTLIDLGRYEEALKVFSEAIRLDGANLALGNERYAVSYAHEGISAALVNLGRDEEALAAIDAAISTGPDVANRYQKRGEILQRVGRASEAQLAFRLAQEVQNRS